MIDKTLIWEFVKGFMIPLAQQLNQPHFMYKHNCSLPSDGRGPYAIAKGSHQNSTTVFHQPISHVRDHTAVMDCPDKLLMKLLWGTDHFHPKLAALFLC